MSLHKSTVAEAATVCRPIHSSRRSAFPTMLRLFLVLGCLAVFVPALLGGVLAAEAEVGANGDTVDATTIKLREEIENLIRQNAALSARAQMAEQKYRDLANQQRAAKVAEASSSSSASSSSASSASDSGDCRCPPRSPREIDPSKAANHNLRDEVDALYEAELQRQKQASVEEADAADSGPKEISIFCQEAPRISIVDLSETDRDNNECLVLNIGAQDLSSRLVLFCDGSTAGDFTD